MKLYPFVVLVCLLIGSTFVKDTQCAEFIRSNEDRTYREFFFQIAEHFSHSPKFQNNKFQYAVIMLLHKNYRHSNYGSRNGWLYDPGQYLYHYTHDTDRTRSSRQYCSETTDQNCLFPNRLSTDTSSAPAINRIGNYFVVNTGAATTDGLTQTMIEQLLHGTILKIMQNEWTDGSADVMMYTHYIPGDSGLVTLLQRYLKVLSWRWRSSRVCVYYTLHTNQVKSAYLLTVEDAKREKQLQNPEEDAYIQSGVITVKKNYYDFFIQIHSAFKTSREPGHTQFAVMMLMDPTFRNGWIRNPIKYLYSWTTDQRTTKYREIELADETTSSPSRTRLGNYAAYNLKTNEQRNLEEQDNAQNNWRHSEHGLLRHYKDRLLAEWQRQHGTTAVPEVLLYSWIFPCQYCSPELIDVFTRGIYADASITIGYTTVGGPSQPDVKVHEWRPQFHYYNFLTFYVRNDVDDVNLGGTQPQQNSGVCTLKTDTSKVRREAFSGCDTAQTCMMECLRVNSECFRLCCCCEYDVTTAMVTYSINSVFAQCHTQSASLEEKRTCWRNWLDRNIGSDCDCASKTIINDEYTSCLEAVTEEQYPIGAPLDDDGNTVEGILVDILRYKFIPSQCSESGRQGFLCTLDAEETGSTYDETVRLVDGNANYEGRVEAKNSQGAWGLVCDDFFDLKDAAVVCRQLRFDDAQEALTRSHFGSGSGNYILDDLGCKGTESDIFSCRNNGVGRSNCRDGEAAGVRCVVSGGLDNDDDDGDMVDDDYHAFEDVEVDTPNNVDILGQTELTTSQPADCSALLPSSTLNQFDGDDDNDDNNVDTNSGVFEIGPSSSRFHAYCDMDTDGGGWTVIQRRQDGDVDFYKNWVEYKEGFGDLNANHWLGLKHIYTLTNSKVYRLRIDMTDFTGKSAYAEYRTFKIESESHECSYCLRLGEFTGGEAGDAMADSDSFTFDGDSNVDQPFSTRDRLNAGYSYNSCVGRRKAGWWFSKGGLCGNTNPNGKYYSYHTKSVYYPNDVIYWYTWQNDRTPLKTIEMKIKH